MIRGVDIPKIYNTFYEELLIMEVRRSDTLDHLRFLITSMSPILDNDEKRIKKYNELITEYNKQYSINFKSASGSFKEKAVNKLKKLNLDKIDFSKVKLGDKKINKENFKINLKSEL